jgi:FkbM family methyltransferase
LPLPGGAIFNGFLPEPIAASVWRHRIFERETTLEILAALPSAGTFVDIGAHFGYFSTMAASLMGKGGTVVSVEPMPLAFAYTRLNLEPYRVDKNIVLVNKAAYHSNTNLDFVDYGVVNSSLNGGFGLRLPLLRRAKPIPISVPADTIDSMLSAAGVGAVDVVKIDAESSEQHVVKGMSDTLRSHRPVVLVELGDAGTDVGHSRAVYDALINHDYRAYVRKGRSTQVYTPTAGVWPYCNLSFYPSERSPSVI